MNGVALLLRFYTLPSMQYDFAASSSSYSLSYLFRVLIEVNASAVITGILKCVSDILENWDSLMEKSSVHTLVELRGEIIIFFLI